MYKLDCPELYDAETGKCVLRKNCTGRVLDDTCVKKCPRTHYALNGECVLACPGRFFAVVDDENVCTTCGKYTLKWAPDDVIVQCVDECPAGYGLDVDLK